MSADEAVEGQVWSDNQIQDYLADERKVDWSTVPDSLLCPSIKFAVGLATEAVVADYQRRYKKALRLYKESEKHFLHAINYDAKLDLTKEILRQKLKQYQDRAKILTSCLDERKRMKKLRELTVTEMI